MFVEKLAETNTFPRRNRGQPGRWLDSMVDGYRREGAYRLAIHKGLMQEKLNWD